MRITVISIIALLVAVAGLLMYVLASSPKVVHIGDVMFTTGTLATLLSTSWNTITVGRVA